MALRVDKAVARAAAGKGRGLFAAAPIAAGELIEAAATIPLSGPDCDLIEATPAGHYYFAHPEDAEAGLLVLGLASLCNHADPATAETRWRLDPELGWVAELIALRALSPGDEITRRYRCPPWFAVLPAA